MPFAKLFDLPDGNQILVMKGDPNDQVGEYRILYITEIDGKRHNIRILYRNESVLNADFQNITQEKAERYYNRMIQVLTTKK